MTVKLTLEFATAEDAQEALATLTGTSLENVASEEPPKKPRGRKAAAAEAVKETATAPKAPAVKEPTVDEVKDAIRAWAGKGADAKEKTTDFVKSFGILKMSDTTPAIRAAMLEKLSDDDGATDEDPMD